MTTKHIVELTLLAAMASPLAVLYGGRCFDNWLDRRLTFDLPEADPWHESPLFGETVAAMGADHPAAEFARRVEAGGAS